MTTDRRSNVFGTGGHFGRLTPDLPRRMRVVVVVSSAANLQIHHRRRHNSSSECLPSSSVLSISVVSTASAVVRHDHICIFRGHTTRHERAVWSSSKKLIPDGGRCAVGDVIDSPKVYLWHGRDAVERNIDYPSGVHCNEQQCLANYI